MSRYRGGRWDKTHQQWCRAVQWRAALASGGHSTAPTDQRLRRLRLSPDTESESLEEDEEVEESLLPEVVVVVGEAVRALAGRRGATSTASEASSLQLLLLAPHRTTSHITCKRPPRCNNTASHLES